METYLDGNIFGWKHIWIETYLNRKIFLFYLCQSYSYEISLKYTETNILFQSSSIPIEAFAYLSISDSRYLYITGSRSTFKLPNRVNLSGSRLYCIARTSDKWSRHWKDYPVQQGTLTRSDFRLNLLLLEGQRCMIYQNR